MTAIKAYFFDLDGTLSDAREGLYVSFRAALKALDLDDLPDERLARFLGPPLPEMFRVLRPDITQQGIADGMAAFRKAFEAGGIQKNSLYPGIRAMLEAIKAQQGIAWIVTSKPQHYAEQVTKILQIEHLIDGVTGAGLDEHDTKAELLATAMQKTDAKASESLMLGDRLYDIVGALENHVLPVGALWGYGSRDELHGAGARHLMGSAEEFRRAFVGAL
jgi:phosphoglycolate phosphatase